VHISPHAALTGAGTILGTVTNSGRLRANSSLSFGNDVFFRPSAALETTIASGIAPRLSMKGMAGIAGRLLIRWSGSLPDPLDEFTILEASSVLGTFSNVATNGRVYTHNGLGSFEVRYTPTAIELTAFQLEDQNGDGVRDSWASQHFATNYLALGNGPGDRNGDLDGDGFTNVEEFLLQTDPTVSNSIVAAIAREGVFTTISASWSQQLLFTLEGTTDFQDWAPVAAEFRLVDDYCQWLIEPAVKHKFYRVHAEVRAAD
jgi:hypothetical protein